MTVLVMMLVLTILTYRSKHHCINTVNTVNDVLNKKGLKRMCDKQKVKTADECMLFEEEAKFKSTDEHLHLQLNDCHRYVEDMKVDFSEAKEKETPLAFSILAHKDAIQLSKLLSTIFRPWNSYCLQLDSKSSPKFIELITRLVKCYKTIYSNTTIFLSQSTISLVWQHSSLLEGDLNCLEQLSQKNPDWKYFVNVVGSEFPLITNYQLIKKLIGVKNSVGFVHTVFPWPEIQARWKYSYRLQDPLVAVEHFFPTLATIQVDHKGHVSQDFDQMEQLNSFKMRKTFWHEEFKTCHGQVRREICNLAFGDLPDILGQKTFVVNKFETDLDPTVVD